MLLLFVLLTACLPQKAPTEDTGGHSTAPLPPCDDADGDGYGIQDLADCASLDPDCDDGDPGVHPGARDDCDGRDQDCDGAVDEDAPVLSSWPDADGDGWGAGDVATTGCAPPAGHALATGDCDDGDATRSPGAQETCDATDQDCDGSTDEGCVPTCHRRVPEDHPTVQGAIDAASAGETLCVGAGTWDENLDFQGKDLYVLALEGPQATWLDGGGRGPVVTFDQGETPAAVLSGFTVTGGWSNAGGGLVLSESSPTLLDLVVWGNEATSCGGGAWVLDGDPHMERLVFQDNLADHGGALCVSWSSPTLADSVLAGNGAAVGGALHCSYAYPTLDHVQVTGNTASTAAAAYLADNCGLEMDGDGFGDSSGAMVSCRNPGGHVSTGGDCDDGDPEENPDAEWVPDADSDGFGDLQVTPLASCTRPEGQVRDATDCDDSNDMVFPGATETCDGVDDDCDGATDEDGTTLFFADMDGDEYGDAASSLNGCDLGPGWVPDATDCDDANAAAHPGAEETCATTWDDDCDGSLGGCGPEGTFSLSRSDLRLLGDESGDGAGSAVAVGDVDGDDVVDLLVGARYANAGGIDSGATWLVPGPDFPSGTLSSAGSVLAGVNAGDLLGQSLAIQDMDGDGLDDLWMGAMKADTSGLDAGSATLVLGPVSTGWESSLAASLVGEQAGDMAGYSLATGELTGDAFPDVVVGATGYDNTTGAAWVIPGPVEGTVDLGDVDTRLVGEGDGFYTAHNMVVADLDGDGLDDLVVGAPDYIGYSPSCSLCGAVYVVHGPILSGFCLDAAEGRVLGEIPYGYTGHSTAVGDADDDGTLDLVVGSMRTDVHGYGSGMVSVFLGPLSGDTSLYAANATFVGEDEEDQLGDSVAVGDVSGDHVGDVLMGASTDEEGGTSAGAAYLFLGPVTGSADLSLADARLTGESRYPSAGSGAVIADLDGGGTGDLLISTSGSSTDASPGAVYVLFGGDP